MARKLSMFFVLSLVLVGLLGVTAVAKNAAIDKMEAYDFLLKPTMKVIGNEGVSTATSRINWPIGLEAMDGGSAGRQIGFSYYDVQQNSTMGRQVDWRGGPQIHFGYTFGPSLNVAGDRTVAYQMFDPISGTLPLNGGAGCPVVDPNIQRAGFCNIDVRPPDPGVSGELSSVVYGAHVSPNTGEDFQTQVFWDQATQLDGYCDFSATNRIGDALEDLFYTADNLIWPKIEYHINGNDTFTYACSYGSSDAAVEPIVFWRVQGRLGDANTWQGQIIDTCFFISQDVVASRISGKVAVVYTVPAAGETEGTSDRDIAYRESTDMGATFGPVMNVTNYAAGVPGHRAWLESAGLYDTDDNLHIVWNANVYDGTTATGRQCRVFHWASQTGVISTVHNAEWNPNDVCGVMDVNSLNTRAASISQCDTSLYVIWVQSNDPTIGLVDDCSADLSAGRNGNGDLWMSVSAGLSGLAWDAARNLTNSYTPDCDTVVDGSNDCASDNWPTMSRYGMNNADFGSLSFPTQAVDEVDPDPSYTGTYFLDVMYIHDKAPGIGTAEDETLTRNSVRWFRLPCVEPVVEANPNLSPTVIGFPTYLQHGVDSSLNLIIENSGTAPLSGQLVVQQNSGPGGWLAVDQSIVSLGIAPNNFDTALVTLNNGGVVNASGTVVNLVGKIVLRVDEPTVRDSISLDIELIIADTIVGLAWDTISTGYISLTVGNNGNSGRAGNTGIAGADSGRANMDFWMTGDECDALPTQDTIPGDARVYLYDNSSFVLWIDSISGTDTTIAANWSIFSTSLATEQAFRPLADLGIDAPGLLADSLTGGLYDAYWSGFFTTGDSSLTMEKTSYAPTDAGDATFIIQRVAMWSTDGSAKSGLVLGEAWDWDIPSDSGADNSAGQVPVSGILYNRGGEYTDPQGDSLECQDNSGRFGGAALIGFEDNSTSGLETATPPERFYTASNPTFVLPSGNFIPIELYRNLTDETGFTIDANTEDQHMVMGLFQDYDLAAGDTLVYYVVMATIRDGVEADLVSAIQAGRTWFTNHAPLAVRPLPTGCCIGQTGNVNNDPGNATDLSDLIYLVNYLFLGGPAPACVGAANINGDAGCSVDLSDLIYLVNFLFLGGPAPAACNPAC